MDDETRIAISGAITAQRFILENLYALVLASAPDPLKAAAETADEMLRQFEDLPSRSAPGTAPVSGDEAHQIIQHGVHHLERFWLGVGRRLESHSSRTG